MPTEDFSELLKRQLKDRETAAEYLSTRLEEGGLREFLKGLRQVADATVGTEGRSKAIDVNRPELYRVLCEEGDPRLATVIDILRELNIRIYFAPQEQETERESR